MCIRDSNRGCPDTRKVLFVCLRSPIACETHCSRASSTLLSKTVSVVQCSFIFFHPPHLFLTHPLVCRGTQILPGKTNSRFLELACHNTGSAVLQVTGERRMLTGPIEPSVFFVDNSFLGSIRNTDSLLNKRYPSVSVRGRKRKCVKKK